MAACLPGTAESARALQRLRQADHLSATLGSTVFQNATWTRYKEGIEFVNALSQQFASTKTMPWKQVLSAFLQYRDMDDVIRRILDVIDNNDIDTDNYYAGLFNEATVPNIQLVGALVGTNLDDPSVQGMGVLILSKLYQFKAVAPVQAEHAMYEKHLTLAKAALSRPTRQHGAVFSALRLVVAIVFSQRQEQIVFEVANKIDLMSTIFDVQYQFSMRENLLLLCDQVSTQLLPHWTAPVLVETHAHPDALHIIMASVQSSPVSRLNKEVACRQLYLLIASNARALQITHDVVLFVANMIREAQFRPSPYATDMRTHDLWSFLEEMMGTASCGLFERSFSMRFLLRSLVAHTSTYNHFATGYDRTVGNTVRRICQLVLGLMKETPGTAVRDQFLASDGLSILFNVIHNHCNEGAMLELGPALGVCMDMLLYLFGTNDGTAELYLTMSTRQHARVLTQFAYGFPDDTLLCANISKFIRQTLINGAPDDENQCTLSRLRDLEKMLLVLLLLSAKDKIFFADNNYVMVVMLKVMTYTFNLYTDNLPHLQALGENTAEYTAALSNMVASLDKMNFNIERLNGYSFVRYHEETSQIKYVQATQAYRAPFDDGGNANAMQI